MTTSTTQPARRGSPARPATRSRPSTTPGGMPLTRSRSPSITRSHSARIPSSGGSITRWSKAKPEMHKKTFLQAGDPGQQGSARPATRWGCRSPSTTTKTSSGARTITTRFSFRESRGMAPGASTTRRSPSRAASECHMNFQPSTDFGAKDFDGQGGRENPQPLLRGSQHGARHLSGRSQARRDQHQVPHRAEGAHRPLRTPRGRGAIEGKLLGPLRPRCADAQEGSEVPRRDRGADPRDRPSLQPGDGRFQ